MSGFEASTHPTEIEPFGGAATCLGGAIRDPLSGRSYVYQAMRVTGAANPLVPVEDTIQASFRRGRSLSAQQTDTALTATKSDLQQVTFPKFTTPAMLQSVLK